uniref:Uncharacterized protein AlNc14C193G8511 n=1 Tax=Albugo laibachii Nc14 TaxID=890382 RepID=F0WQ29_9STRA|nr:conserved hypothetical protein [Albugo laibachii Nc14]|eukprot:CCA23434.1 conserved hypothetical protein [Albugo laibachii Nc14]
MERFFTVHNVIEDLDPDQIHQTSESDFEDSVQSTGAIDQEIKVRSVHDPAGPWNQAEIADSNTWGQPGKKFYQEFQSGNTGPKGVLRDHKLHRQNQQVERELKGKERKMILLRIAKGCVEPHNVEKSLSSDEEFDPFLPQVLSSYNEKRLSQLRQRARCRQFGTLRYISPTEFVDSINVAKEGEMTIVHLYHPDNYACKLINNHLEIIANLHPRIQMLATLALKADKTFSISDLPVFLVYHSSELLETHVNISEKLDGEFTQQKLERFIVNQTQV